MYWLGIRLNQLFLKMKTFNYICLLLFIFLALIPAVKASYAQEKRAAVLVNPIRGGDFWNHNFSLLETPKKQYELIRKDNLPASWLIRYDALMDGEVQDFLKNLDSSQDVGIFFEVTPAFTRDAGVNYNQSSNWHQAKSVLLTGYSPGDRIKLIDTAFKKFKEILGKDPKSVGAWWIDAYSLGYMEDKYGIEANLDVADQYMTDSYQVWGQYWSTPFYPSKSNALVPAQSEEQKLGVVTMQWAIRDPFNGYGNGVFESTYSVQANDYILHDLGIDYFEKLLNIYPQTTVGLENDFDYSKFGAEFQKQLEVISKQKSQGSLNIFNMGQFAKNYFKNNPGISPNVLIVADDPLGGGGKVVWLNTPRYRLGWFANSEGAVIRDLRLFNDRGEEVCFKTACSELKLAYTPLQAIDEGNYSTKWVLDNGKISDIKVKKLGFGAEITYKNQSGEDRVLKFLENDVEFEGKIDTLDGAILKVVTNEQSLKPKEESFDSKLDWGTAGGMFFTNFIRFSALVFLFFIIPGFAITKRKILAIPLGICVFTLTAWVLGFLKLDYLIWILPAVSIFFIIRQGKKIDWRIKISLKTFLVGLVIIAGSASWLLTQVKNGSLFNYGFGFWGPNGHDGIWHLSLISQLQKNVPPQNPVFAGESLTSYHYFFDLLVAKSANILNIDSVELLFRLFPLLISILAGLLIFKVTEKISKSFAAAVFSTFFLYFGGSFGWILTYLKDKSFGGETMFWAQQSVSTLLNPPYAISIVIFLSGLLLFYEIKESEKIKWGLVFALTLLWGSLIEFKAYAGVLTLAALFLCSVQNLVFKRQLRILLIFIPVLILSLIVFLPNNLGSSSLIEFKPFWLIESMITATDRLGWNRLTLTLQSGVWYKLAYGYGLGVLIFIIGNLGTRIFSIGAVREFFKQSFLFYFLLLSLILPLIFIQKGTAWNIVQFFYYGLLVLNIFAGIGVINIYKKIPKVLGFGFVILVIILTVPTTLGTFEHYIPERPPAKISRNELEALNFLKNQPEGKVLTLPYDERLRERFNAPRPLAVYTSTAYVSAFSGKPVFFEDTVNLEILGIDYKGRLNMVRDFMKIKDRSQKILKTHNIEYVYLPKLFNFQVDEGSMGVKTIFENDEAKVYRVL